MKLTMNLLVINLTLFSSMLSLLYHEPYKEYRKKHFIGRWAWSSFSLDVI